MRVDTALLDVVSNVRDGEPDVAPSLVSSVASQGLIQPIVVLDTGDGRYRILDGHRRFAAVKELGLAEVDIHVSESDTSAEMVIGAQVAANTQREDMTEWQLAQAAMNLKDMKVSVKDSAQLLGVTQKEVSAYRKAGSNDLTDEQGNQFSLEGLVEMADAVKETNLEASDLASEVIKGARDLYVAVRNVKHDIEEIEIMDELATLQGEWAQAGIAVFMEDPSLTGDKDKWGYDKKDKNILRVIDNDYSEGINIDLIKHIKLDCHAIQIIPARAFGHTSWRHWCMNAKLHNEKGKSDLKSLNKKTSGTAMSDVEKAERRAEREAKKVRMTLAVKWLEKPLVGKTKWFPIAIAQAVEGQPWREDDTRTIVKALMQAELVEPRPTGAEYDWYNQELESYLEDYEGVDLLRWQSQALAASRYIEKRWPDAQVVEMIENA